MRLCRGCGLRGQTHDKRNCPKLNEGSTTDCNSIGSESSTDDELASQADQPNMEPRFQPIASEFDVKKAFRKLALQVVQLAPGNVTGTLVNGILQYCSQPTVTFSDHEILFDRLLLCGLKLWGQNIFQYMWSFCLSRNCAQIGQRH
ncbi:hypothetical protein FNV43_RR24503 [Rhamnella rubrinervis]|uniref:Uncharacterized protein n=1 Tax=Rhamnella rubrinervis TaxID=2594499 RepID=A0A8K0DMW9_9ROSA|nr:hypothetical protein FNV43_RR24503 [Rhamnella rubrinervis]